MHSQYVKFYLWLTIRANDVEVLTWEGSIANLLPPLINGGPTGAIAAYPLVMFGVLMMVLVMAEMASM